MDRTPVQNVARLAGVVLPAGRYRRLHPRLTTNLFDGLEFAGTDGNAELLGIFEVSVLHNIVHGLFGLADLALAERPAAHYLLVGGGAIYILPWLAAQAAGRRRLDPRRTPPLTGCRRPRRRHGRARPRAHARATRPDDRVAGQRSGTTRGGRGPPLDRSSAANHPSGWC